MREFTVKAGAEIDLGKRGENLAQRVVFDVAEWRDTYGEGSFVLLHQRNGDKIPYPCVVEADKDKVYWDVTNADTAYAGRGHVELQYRIGDIVAKSVTYITKTTQAMGTASETPPEAAASWLDTVLQAQADIAQNTEVAAESAASAEAAAEAAVDAAERVEKAVTEDLDSYVNAAQDAMQDAIAAQSAAEEAQAAAEAARDDAQAIAGGDFASKPYVDNKVDEVLAEKGEPNGIAVLDEEGKIPEEHLPEIGAAADHAAQHAANGRDPIPPGSIGAVPQVAVYYKDPTSADTVLVPFALINKVEDSNAELNTIISGSFCYLWTFFYGTVAETSRRFQLAATYNGIPEKIASRIYSTNGWTAWKEITTTDYSLNKGGDTMTGNLLQYIGNHTATYGINAANGIIYIQHKNPSKTETANFAFSARTIYYQTTKDSGANWDKHDILHTGNSKRSTLVATETTPETNNEICWLYE